MKNSFVYCFDILFSLNDTHTTMKLNTYHLHASSVQMFQMERVEIGLGNALFPLILNDIIYVKFYMY